MVFQLKGFRSDTRAFIFVNISKFFEKSFGSPISSRIFEVSKGNNHLKIKDMNEVTKAIKGLEKTISKVAGTQIDLTYARTNMVTLAWDGEDIEVFNRLQKFLDGKLFGYEYDEECEMSVCCLSI